MRGTSGGLVPFSVPFIVRSGQKGASEEVVTSTVYSITSPYGLQSPSIMDLIGVVDQFHFRFRYVNSLSGSRRSFTLNVLTITSMIRKYTTASLLIQSRDAFELRIIIEYYARTYCQNSKP